MQEKMKYIRAIAIFILLIGCDNSDKRVANNEPKTVEAASLQSVVFEFVNFGDDAQQGRFAIFKITNDSEGKILGYRGELFGYNADGEQSYNFSWSQAAFPTLIESGKTLKSNIGFQIPITVEKVEFVSEEFDILME